MSNRLFAARAFALALDVNLESEVRGRRS